MKVNGLCVLVALSILRPIDLSSAGPETNRLRTDHPLIANLIAAANERSRSFHELTEALAKTDGVVYVIEGRCGHGVRACVPHSVTQAGGFRLLRILIEPNDVAAFSRHRLASIIAHELHHAVELLQDPKITNTAKMFMFYGREAPRSGAFETTDASLVANRVWHEMEGSGVPRESQSLAARGDR